MFLLRESELDRSDLNLHELLRKTDVKNLADKVTRELASMDDPHAVRPKE